MTLTLSWKQRADRKGGFTLALTVLGVVFDFVVTRIFEKRPQRIIQNICFYDPANAFLYASHVGYAKVYIVNYHCCSIGAMIGRQEAALLDESSYTKESLYAMGCCYSRVFGLRRRVCGGVYHRPGRRCHRQLAERAAWRSRRSGDTCPAGGDAGDRTCPVGSS